MNCSDQKREGRQTTLLSVPAFLLDITSGGKARGHFSGGSEVATTQTIPFLYTKDYHSL